ALGVNRRREAVAPASRGSAPCAGVPASAHATLGPSMRAIHCRASVAPPLSGIHNMPALRPESRPAGLAGKAPVAPVTKQPVRQRFRSQPSIQPAPVAQTVRTVFAGLT